MHVGKQLIHGLILSIPSGMDELLETVKIRPINCVQNILWPHMHESLALQSAHLVNGVHQHGKRVLEIVLQKKLRMSKACLKAVVARDLSELLQNESVQLKKSRKSNICGK